MLLYEGVRRPVRTYYMRMRSHLIMGVANSVTPIREFFSTNSSKTALRENLDPPNITAIRYALATRIVRVGGGTQAESTLRRLRMKRGSRRPTGSGKSAPEDPMIA